APGSNFSWNRDVGCSANYDGDSFDLVFYHAGTLAKVLTIPGLGSPSHALTAGEFNTLVAAGHNMLWAVEGRNGSSPATGPYLGENSPIVVNRPPVANAGTDVVQECTSPAGRNVSLNGTGSSDADGDALTYTWSAPGITFSPDNHSATPTATFPIGSTVVTLTVSDGIAEDSDQMTVQIVDTTPPAVAWPSSIPVE